MTLYKGRYRIESARLPEWDYSSAAWYFVTICSRDHHCVFGDIINGEMVLSPVGSIVAEEWHNAAIVRDFVDLDAWVIMPNHIHGIIIINDHAPVETSRRDVLGHPPDRPEIPHLGQADGDRRPAPDKRSAETRRPNGSSLRGGSLGSIIGQFKSVCTKRIRFSGDEAFAWQSRFYDHVIHDERSLDKIRAYIIENPVKWESDKNNPANIPPVETPRRGVLDPQAVRGSQRSNVETSRRGVLSANQGDPSTPPES